MCPLIRLCLGAHSVFKVAVDVQEEIIVPEEATLAEHRDDESMRVVDDVHDALINQVKALDCASWLDNCLVTGVDLDLQVRANLPNEELVSMNIFAIVIEEEFKLLGM